MENHNKEAENEIERLDAAYLKWVVSNELRLLSADELLAELVIQQDTLNNQIKWLKEWTQQYENAVHIRDN